MLPAPVGANVELRLECRRADHMPAAPLAFAEMPSLEQSRPAGTADPAVSRRPARVDLGQFRELVLHLAHREITTMNRFTLLGWLWPLARQLAQLAVLVFIFDRVLDLGIPDYPVFVFSGLVAWTWFSTAMWRSSVSLLDGRHLVFQPRFPTIVLPIVSVAVPLVDVAMAMPVLLVMLATTGHLSASALALPALFVIQFVLCSGLAWIVSAATVYVRDIPNLVGVGVMILFYLTPVFYAATKVPAQYKGIIELNPMTTLLQCYRAVLLGSPFPPLWRVGLVVALSLVLAAGGYALFRRLQGGFVDEL